MPALTNGQKIPPDVRHAATLLADDPAFKAARDRLIAVYFRKWQNSNSVEERERLHMAARQVSDVMTELVYLRDHDKIDESRIDKMAKGAK